MARIGVFYFLFLNISFLLYGQVDVTKYASSDLFEVKPVVAQEFTGHVSLKEESVSSMSWFENQLEIASDHWSKGDLDDAIHLYESLSEDYPEVGVLDFYVGLINYEKERNDDAVKSFNSALKKDPMLLEARYFLGAIALAQNNRKEAKNHFKVLTSIPAFLSYGYHGMGLLALEKGNSFKAYNLFKKCLAADSSFLQAYIPMISMDLFFDRIKSARKLIEGGVKANPLWQQGIIARGMISLLQDGNTKQFEKDIDYLIELAPDNYHYHLMRGFLQVELKNYHTAVENFKTAYFLQIDSVRKGEFKFNTRLKRDEGIQRSLRYYDEHFAMEPKVRSYVDQGVCLYMSDNSKQALLMFDSANQIEENAVSHTFKGAIYRSLWGKESEAIESFSEAIRLDSTHWSAYGYRAELYMQKGQQAGAYEDYERLIALQPKRKEGYKNRGIILMNDNRAIEAYKSFSFALAIDPTDNDLYFNRGLAAISMGYVKEAENDLMKIVTNKPKDGEAYYFLHITKLNQKDTLQALVYLDSASKFSKYNHEYHEQLIALAEKNADFSTCLRAHDRLVRYNRWNSEYLLNRGKFLYRNAKYEEAISDFEKVIKRRPRSGEGYYYLGESLLKTDQLKSGRKALKKSEKYGYVPPQ